MQKWLTVILIGTAALVLSCGHGQILESITLLPSGGFIFEGYLAAGQFKAIGNYAYPTQTKDITDQVLWQLDVANFGTITQTGLVTYTRTDGCGSGFVTATSYSDSQNPSAGTAVIGSALVEGVNAGNATKCAP